MSPRATPANASSTSLPGLVLGALGVVFGDIGTNVLFAFRSAFEGPGAVPIAPDTVLGLLSLIFWALVLVLGVKYVSFVMRADNRGEGGILAMFAVLAPVKGLSRSQRGALLTLSILGAALVYGDGVITPAISVLAAIEGLGIAQPALEPLVVPAAVAILVALFLLQHRGTGRIGSLFGPVMVAWFIAIGALGGMSIARQPAVLSAVSPLPAVAFFRGHGMAAFLSLGAVVLAVAGAEALYADLGQFGRRATRTAWFGLVFPALLLNYFGQGALLLGSTTTVIHPFYGLVPPGLFYPMVGLATAATIIASQALISGSFSITQQAVNLGLLPHIEVRHTSPARPGQVFVPVINAALMVATIALVLAFRQSARLASAYGMAVALAMASTTLLFYVIARHRWHWATPAAFALTLLFFGIDLSFIGANVPKILHGAWIPLALGTAVFIVMTTWRSGVRLLRGAVEPAPVDDLLRLLADRRLARVPGTAVFLTWTRNAVPPALLQSLTRMEALHRRIILLALLNVERPFVDPARRLRVQEHPESVLAATLSYGYMESPNVRSAVEQIRAQVNGSDWEPLTYFVGSVTPVITDRPGLRRWRKRLFDLLWRNAQSARAHLGLPPGEVVELGIEREI